MRESSSLALKLLWPFSPKQWKLWSSENCVYSARHLDNRDFTVALQNQNTWQIKVNSLYLFILRLILVIEVKEMMVFQIALILSTCELIGRRAVIVGL